MTDSPNSPKLPLHYTFPFGVTPATTWFKVEIIKDITKKEPELPQFMGSFTKVSGLGQSRQPFRFQEGGRNYGQHARMNPAGGNEVTLECGTVHMDELWLWSREVDAATADGPGFRRKVIITHMGPGGIYPNRAYVLKGAWPVEWKTSDLDAATGNVAVDTLRLAFDDLLVLGLDDSTKATKEKPETKIKPEPQQFTPDLAKASLTCLDEVPKHLESLRKKLGIDDEIHKFEVQFNPEKLQINRNITLGAPKPVNRDVPRLNACAQGLDTLTFSLILDATEPRNLPWGGGTWKSLDRSIVLMYRVKWLNVLSTPMLIKGQQRAPRVGFHWNGLDFEGVISSLNCCLEVFDHKGRPLRAKVDLTLTGVLDGTTERTEQGIATKRQSSARVDENQERAKESERD